METIFKVEDMHCSHCVESITNALMDLSGVESVVADLEKRTVTVQHADAVAKAAITEAIKDQGFTVAT